MHVFQLPISLYSFKLRLALKLKGLDLDLREPPGGSYRSPAYRLINPAGTIPALIDDDLMLCETDSIIEYLEDLGLGDPLFPANLQERAGMRMLSRWNDLQLEPAVRRLFPHIAPDKRDHDVIASADVMIAAKLFLLAQGLNEPGPYATGPVPGMADCGLVASLVWLKALAGPLALSSSPAPRLETLFKAMASHPKLAAEIADYRHLIENWLQRAGA
jgi:glutathione S-transferase